MSDYLIDEDTDLLAGEFVLGTLDSEERANAQSLLRMDHGFIAMVRIWERRFGELHLMVEPVEPGAKILQRIKAKIAEIAPSEPAPDGKPPGAVMPSPDLPAATGSSTSAELPKPVDAAAGGGTPPPLDVPASGITPKPEDGTANAVSAQAQAEPEKPAETTPAAEAVITAATDVQPSAETQPQEPVAKSESGPVATDAIPAPPPLPPPPLKLPDEFRDARPGRRPEITIDVIRSRGRWRAFGVCMALLVMGLVALLAAWRLVPDRLPAGLRPAELMMFFGIESIPEAAPPVKRAPPESQFDE
jgi:hypothetical protein